MLDEGFRAGLEHMGVDYRTMCYVEREAYAAAVLVARMEEGSLDKAPVWPDISAFDAHRWRGKVDCVVAGFPCQDLSVAGRRAGLDGKRSGLFFDVVRIARDCGAAFLFLENVAGIASATAAVVDAQEGALEERAASRVLGELADSGWDAEWLTLSASDVGASHGRARWFCFAWRKMADARHGTRTYKPFGFLRSDREANDCACGEAVDDAASARCDGTRQRPTTMHKGWERLPGAGYADMGDATSDGRRERRAELHGWQGRPNPGRAVGAVDGTMGHASGGELPQPGRRPQERSVAGSTGEIVLADAGQQGQQGCEWRGAPDQRNGQAAHGSTPELRGAPFLFAPGPADPRWPEIIEKQPELAPALEPGFRGMVDGVAFDLDDSRAARLRCIGNGVVALQAAAATVILVRRAGIFG